ncbi:MAG: peptide chain release factor N(5)-glutamine methyltransferase [Candidatus Omnitrophica bacterium]|nr:peptide chain release factor N(5)-glutamine methyltransferase [Candidatus Omnitrophota bacterium]MBU4473409.1 peptide chain release factor N(5)-glutamine methyltransferase [Candidatus Omnitrophota bacterium]
MNEAELLFTQILHCNRLSLYLDDNLRLDKDKSYLISEVFKKRILGEPIEYILGETEFMGLEFRLTPDVFIPRPETEILVEAALKLVKCLMFNVGCLNILDIGTGTGCIAISLAKFISAVKVIAIDISSSALEIGEENSCLNGVEDKIKFIQANIFNIKHNTLNIEQFDIIVSNPPYIPTAEIDNLHPGIKYEPYIALDGGRDGLGFYRRIIRDSADYLKEDGLLIMEMGFDQKEAIKNIFQNSENFKIIDVVQDYNNIDRVIIAQMKKARYG